MDRMPNLFANPFSTYLSLFGCLLFVVGMVVLWRRLLLLTRGQRVEGVVVEQAKRLRAQVGDKDAFMPVVAFRVNGLEHRVQSSTGGSAKSLPIGSRVQVSYLPSDPRLAEIDQGIRMWIAPFSLLGFAVALLSIAAHSAS